MFHSCTIYCVHTHWEANYLIVPGCLCFLHWLHERPGIRVTLRQNDQSCKNKMCVCDQITVCVSKPHLHMLQDSLQSAVQLIWVLQFLPKGQ